MSASALLDVESLRADVDAALADHVAALADELYSVGLDEEPVEALRVLLAGGKRLRAAFCYWSWRAHPTRAGARPAPREAVLGVGVALELFQAAALVHDDVMDESDTRRGLPAAHRRFATLHAAHGWDGPPDRFGESVAILLGDIALIAAERAFAASVADLRPEVAGPARRIFDTMRTEVIAGQYLDVLVQAQPLGIDADSDEKRARMVVRAKSARYSVEHPLALGATLACATDDAVRRIQRIGLPLGEAFQLRDDILGVHGDPATTGKPAGDDLREGKRTVLLARALRHASPADRDLLTSRIGRRDMTDVDVATLRDVLERTGATRDVEELITRLAEPALAELQAAPLDDPGRTMLGRLGRAAVDRRA